MAKVTITPAPAPPAKVTLEMDHQEASALAAVIAFVSGSPTRSVRGVTDRIYTALIQAGYGWDKKGYGREEYNQGQGAGIYFTTQDQ